ncbi:MAG: hypothetical protein HY075_07610 [Deltaproteobacteria bacterium]|nr:hypothetical protein [Deltaproteobacteria bacterium]
MATRMGRFFLTLTLTLGFATAVAGCNFFGKQVDQPPPAPGQLADGSIFIGTWTQSASSIDANGNPAVALTWTYTFDAAGSVRVEVRNQKAGGGSCAGTGQYRLIGSDTVLIYVQSETPANCGLPAQLQFSHVKVTSSYIDYIDPKDNGEYRLFPAAQPGALPPVGVWDFAGAGGIDYVFFDQNGYFLMQTTIDNTAYLMLGYYIVSSGQLSLHFFGNDPSQVAGTTLFSSYLTNGSALELTQTTSTGDVVLDGVLR